MKNEMVTLSSGYDDGYEQGVEDVMTLSRHGYDLSYIERLTQGQRQELIQKLPKKPNMWRRVLHPNKNDALTFLICFVFMLILFYTLTSIVLLFLTSI